MTNGKLTERNYVVVDDFLAPSEQSELFQLLEEEIYVGAQFRAHRTAVREWDGDSRLGPAISTIDAKESAVMVMPTKTAYDALGYKVHEFVKTELTEFIGQHGKDWNRLAFRAFRYPPNTGLTWHVDGEYKAAFTYYAHPEWKLHWGGMLLVGSQVVAPSADGRVTSFHRASYGTSYAEGVFLAPIPNRLVFIRPGTPHCITPVTPAAGDRHRTSVAGFAELRKSASVASAVA